MPMKSQNGSADKVMGGNYSSLLEKSARLSLGRTEKNRV